MNTSWCRLTLFPALAFLLGSIVASAAEPAAESAAPSKAQQALEQASAENKYTFLLFYKDESQAARTMAQMLKDAAAARPEQVVLTYVQVGSATEKQIVSRFGVSRAPMPLSMVIAPNGAITGVLAQKATEEAIENAFVTPTMMRAMKSLQEGKLVLVCVQGEKELGVPGAITDFQADPHFKGRVASVSFNANDPAEGKFINQMQLDAQAIATKTVLLAPPGVLVGKFDSSASKDDIAAALAKAGKCCDDPNCKHNQQQNTNQAPRTTKQGTNRQR